MPDLQQLYLENRYLQLNAHYPYRQPKNWIHALIAKVLDSSDLSVTDDPQHFSSTPIYQKFVQLCSALHPRRIPLSHLASLFKQIYQIDVDLKPHTQTFREKILANQHRLQYSLLFNPSKDYLNKYEVRSFFIFDNQLVVLQLLCNRSQTKLPDGESVVSWQINYVIELYHLSSDIKTRFHNKNELFNINDEDDAHRLLCVQLLSIITNNVTESELLGLSTNSKGISLEYADYREAQYVVSALAKHKYLVTLCPNDLKGREHRKLWRLGRDQLCLVDGRYILAVNYDYGEKDLFFRLYDDAIPTMEHSQHKLSVKVGLNPLSRRVDLLVIEIAQIGQENQFQDGVIIRIFEGKNNSGILVNVIKQDACNSYTYQLRKRSTLEKSVTIDEDIYQKLSSLLIRSRLDVVLSFIVPHINWEDYCFVNKIEAIYSVSEESDTKSNTITALQAPKDTASIADLDRLLADAEFCPKLSDRLIDTMVKNIAKCSLPDNAFTQDIVTAEEVARAEFMNAYAQGLYNLMAVQRNDLVQLENNRRDKLEHESLRACLQINKKYQEAYLQIVGLTLLAARHHSELALFAEYQQLLLPLMLMHHLEVNEELERHRMETVESQDLRSLADFKAVIFDALDSKREAVRQCVFERRAMVDAARDNRLRLQRDNEQRRALQALEEETRAHQASRSLRTLDNLWRFNTFPVTGTYTKAQLFELGNRTQKTVEQYVNILKEPCASNHNSQPIFETLFLAENEGWDVFIGGSASRGSPWANDLDIKLSPTDKNVTDEQRFKLFLIFEALLERATDVRGYPEKGLITFDIQGLRIPVNIVIYLTYKGQYYNDPLYTDDVVVRIKREPQRHLSSRQIAVGSSWLQFYRHRYHPSNVEQSVDEIIDLVNVGHILQTQQIHARRFDPPGILRVLRDIAYSPDKERVNAEPLKVLISKMLTDVPSSLYQDRLHEFYEGKHKVAPEYFQAFLSLLKQYGLPEHSNQPLTKPQPDGRFAGHFLTRPTRYGYAHLIELLVGQYKQQSVSARQLTVLECIEKVLERQGRKESFMVFRDFAAQVRGVTSAQPAASSYTK